MSSRTVRVSSVLLAAALALSACGGGEDDAGGSEESSSPSATQSSGDATTDPGTSLDFGETATVTWQPKKDLEGTVDVTVQGATLAPKGDFAGFTMDKAMRKSTAYYVKVRAKNTGKTNLGGFELPVFLDNGTDVLFPPAKFASSFKPCTGRDLPDKFGPGKSARLCLVFLAGEGTTLQSVSLRADEDEATIDWSGKVTKPGKAAKKGKGAMKGKKKSS